MTFVFLTIAYSLFTLGSNTSNSVFYGEYKSDEVVQNYLSPVRNQNQPVKCEASWAFAIASAMSDQFNLIKYVGHQPITLSPQVLMTCHSNPNQKTCDYKDKDQTVEIENIFETLKTDGIPDETCNPWKGYFTSKCDFKNRCKWAKITFDFINPPETVSIGYHSYKIQDWGKITSDKTDPQEKNKELFNLVAQSLMQTGPLVCQINHSGDLFKFRDYQVKAYEESKEADYATWVNVVGFIEDPNSQSSEKEYL